MKSKDKRMRIAQTGSEFKLREVEKLREVFYSVFSVQGVRVFALIVFKF